MTLEQIEDLPTRHAVSSLAALGDPWAIEQRVRARIQAFKAKRGFRQLQSRIRARVKTLIERNPIIDAFDALTIAYHDEVTAALRRGEVLR